MNIAIFGSCVSRDTCEFIPEANVLIYVARQSAVSLNHAHGETFRSVENLRSDFQRRMVVGDLTGDGSARIIEKKNSLDVILIDLTDERRGYWAFPDGTTITNSLEAEYCGVTKEARQAGARLVEFGSDEHFKNWTKGFTRLTTDLANAGLLRKTILLDIEWAASRTGARHPRWYFRKTAGRANNNIGRGFTSAFRKLREAKSIKEVLNTIPKSEPTDYQIFASRAISANKSYIRYRRLARELVPAVVTKQSRHLRIDPDHRWGPQPFHYRHEDYQSIVRAILGRGDL